MLSIYCEIKKNKDGQTPIDECFDSDIKNIFLQYGYKEDGDYEKFEKVKKANKLEKRTLMTPKSLTPDDFTFYRLLGKGSFGEVFLVSKKAEESKKLYALKVLNKDKVFTKKLQRYALTERNVMSVINHPFMAKLHFAFQSATKLFLIMEYYPGGDLGKLIGRKKSIP